MEDGDDLSPDKNADSRLRIKKNNQTETDIGQGDRTNQARLWKRDDFMERATSELDAAREGGKIKGYKFKKK